MNKIVSLSAGLLAATLGGAFAADQAPANPPPPPPHEGAARPGMGRPGMDMGKELGLTDEQKQKVETIRKAHAEEMAAARKAVQEAHESKDAAAVKKAMDAAKALHEKIQAEVDAVLTPEQKAKADELRKAREARMKERRGEHRGGRGGEGRDEGKGEGKPQPPPPPAG